MPGIKVIPTEILQNRHRLTPQQINSLFGKNVVKESFEDKTEALGKVAEFLRVTDELNSEGISFIPLKGPVLSFRLYGDATWRQYRDFDILVDKESLGKTEKTLQRLGYVLESDYYSDNHRIRTLILNNSIDISFWKPVKDTTIEIHWQLFRRYNLGSLKLNNVIMQNQSTIDFGNRTFKVLINEMELLYLIIHGGLHFWRRLKWLYDINTFLCTKTIDWNKFKELMDELNASRLVGLCRHFQSLYFPESPNIPYTFYTPDYLIKFCQRTIYDPHDDTSKSINQLLKEFRFAFIAFPGISYKIKTIRSYVVMSSLKGRIRRYFGI